MCHLSPTMQISRAGSGGPIGRVGVQRMTTARCFRGRRRRDAPTPGSSARARSRSHRIRAHGSSPTRASSHDEDARGAEEEERREVAGGVRSGRGVAGGDVSTASGKADEEGGRRRMQGAAGVHKEGEGGGACREPHEEGGRRRMQGARASSRREAAGACREPRFGVAARYLSEKIRFGWVTVLHSMTYNMEWVSFLGFSCWRQSHSEGVFQKLLNENDYII